MSILQSGKTCNGVAKKPPGAGFAIYLHSLEALLKGKRCVDVSKLIITPLFYEN